MPSCELRTKQTDKQNRNTDKTQNSQQENKQRGHRDKAYTSAVHASLLHETKFMKRISIAVLVDCKKRRICSKREKPRPATRISMHSNGRSWIEDGLQDSRQTKISNSKADHGSDRLQNQMQGLSIQGDNMGEGAKGLAMLAVLG